MKTLKFKKIDAFTKGVSSGACREPKCPAAHGVLECKVSNKAYESSR